jgi:hypothetical protein
LTATTISEDDTKEDKQLERMKKELAGKVYGPTDIHETLDTDGNGKAKKKNHNKRRQRSFHIEESGEERDDHKKRIYIHKYSTGVPLVEAVIVYGQPLFLQLKNGSSKEPVLFDKIESDNLILYPKEIQSQLSEPYVFEFKEEIVHYLNLAKKLTNFDQIFKLVKSIYKKYVDAEEHYIRLLSADTLYSYFQDKFATTHYVICIGGNSSGKNSILMTFKYLGYRVLLATGVSAANVYTYLGNVEDCQGTIAEDEINNLENDPEKLNTYKSGYSKSSGRIPKIDLHSGRVQEVYLSYCFKIFATERSLDNSIARGLLDRSFEIQCITGTPKYNIKEVFDKANEETHTKLKLELQKTRKLLLAYRMLHYEDTIKDVKLNIINREAELTKPLIRLFQDSPLVLEELLPALSKLLNAKRKVKSNSLESKLYTAVRNLIPCHGYVIDYQSIINEVMRITNGEEISGEKASFYSTDIGKVTHRKIICILVDSFKAERTHKGSGNDKKRAVQFKEEDIKRKDREYNVPDKIEILLDNEKEGQSTNELDSFDVIFGSSSNDDDDDSSSEALTITTHNQHDYSSSGTEGTEGTQLGDKGQSEGIADTVNNSQTSHDTTNHTNNNNDNDKNSYQLNTEKSLDKDQCNSINQANNLSAYTPVASLASQSSHYLSLDQTVAIEKKITATTTTSSVVDVSQNIYRLGNSDSWACKYCKLKGDKWFMGQHTCKGQPST